MRAIELPWEPPVNGALPAEPPLRVLVAERTPELLRQVVAQFRLEVAERYRRRDITGDDVPETFCNRALADISEAYGAPVPWKLANDQVRWLASQAAVAKGWEPASELDARRAAAAGQLAVAGYLNGAGHGHVAVLVPPHAEDGPDCTRIAQAGRRNFSYGTLADGFGRYPSRFFIHDARRVCR